VQTFVNTACCLIAAFAVAVAYLVLKQGSGRGDLLAFCFLTLPLGLAIALIGHPAQSHYSARREPFRSMLAWLIGAGLGYGYGVIVNFVLGVGFGMFSFPVVVCWI
jgi:hypothetical protein